MKTLYRFSFGFLSLLFTIILFGQAKDAEEHIPLDQHVINGKLKNGLTYYIRQNTKPEKRVEFRLVVNAGSIQMFFVTVLVIPHEF